MGPQQTKPASTIKIQSHVLDKECTDPSRSRSTSSSPVQKLEGCWQLVGKTERQDEIGRLEFNEKDGVLKFGSTVLYLNPEPLSCHQSCDETIFSFEVTDATNSSAMSDDTTVSDSFDFGEPESDIDFDIDFNMPQEPGAFDVCLKADGSIEGDASAGTLATTEDMMFKFTGTRV